MKLVNVLILFSLLVIKLGACSGDCVACHPSLIKKDGKMDQDHKILEKCKLCHIDGTKIKMFDTNSSEHNKTGFEIVKLKETNSSKEKHTECGSDCWQCHDIKKVSKIDISEHKVLGKCIDCHVKIDKSVMNGDALFSNPKSPLEGGSLMDILKGGK